MAAECTVLCSSENQSTLNDGNGNLCSVGEIAALALLGFMLMIDASQLVGNVRNESII